ncbi:hypothetical protein D3C85_1342030 [compost metagenome]
MLTRQGDGIHTVIRLRDDCVTFAIQQQAYGKANDRVIVDDHHLVGGLAFRFEEIIQIDHFAHSIAPLARFGGCQDREATCTVDPRNRPVTAFRNRPTPPCVSSYSEELISATIGARFQADDGHFHAPPCSRERWHYIISGHPGRQPTAPAPWQIARRPSQASCMLH